MKCLHGNGMIKILMVLAVLTGFMCCDQSTSTIPEPVQNNCLNRAVFGVFSQSPYVLPYPVGREYSVLQRYCTPNGSHSNQLAYDFEMPIGSPVTAARAGVVMQVVDIYADTDHQSSHFNYLFIQHDDGTVAFYAHLQLHSITVILSAQVEQGQRLGNSGSSGTPVADLHFGVYQGMPVRDGYDVAVNFRNAQGRLDNRGGLQVGVFYLALPY